MHFVKNIRAVPYSPTVSVVMCDNINEARKALNIKLYDKSNWDGATVGLSYEHTKRGTDTYTPYLFVNVLKHKTFSDLIGTIIHESDHITNMILKYSGVQTDYDNDEAHTYLQGYLASESLKMFFEHQESLSLIQEEIIIKPKEYAETRQQPERIS